jgi:hypothetical protein
VNSTPCQDSLGCFLAAYEEYLAGTRPYEDLPPAFARCPGAQGCGLLICEQCHPGTARLYTQGRAVSAYFRLCTEVPST